MAFSPILIPRKSLSLELSEYESDAVFNDGSLRSNRFNEGPILKYGTAQQVKKGEDFFQIKVDPSFISSFSVFDGHNGPEAAKFCKENLVNEVLNALPPGVEGDDLTRGLPRAMVVGFVKTDKDFQSVQKTSGSTVACVIVDKWTVTVGGLGDSRVVLHTSAGITDLSVDHRLEVNSAEVDRIKHSGGEIGRIAMAGRAVGPLRCWPGGLCLSRAIGDFDVGEYIVPIPHVRQVKVPFTGGRLIIASDGVWDAMSSLRAAKICRGECAEDAAIHIVKEAVRTRGLRDDVTCIVVDILNPQSAELSPVPRPQNRMRKGLSQLFSRSPRSHNDDLDESESVEEIFEDDSPILLERLGSLDLPVTQGALLTCVICMKEQPSSAHISVHAGNLFEPRKVEESAEGSPRSLAADRFSVMLCSSCQKMNNAMQGKRPPPATSELRQQVLASLGM